MTEKDENKKQTSIVDKQQAHQWFYLNSRAVRSKPQTLTYIT